MAFIETPSFPASIARNAQRRRLTSTDIVTLASGFEQRNSRWVQKRRRYDIGIAVRTSTDYEEIVQWFEAMGGPATGFRFGDPHDCAATHSDGLLYALTDGVSVGTVGYGYGVPTMQLVRAYARGSASHYREIRKPRSGQVALKRAGVDVMLGAGAGQAAVASTTGVVTFVADQSRSISAHVAGATHKFTLASALAPNVSVGQRVYVSGVSGDTGSVVNNRSHVVGIVSGADITVNTTTTGLTLTGGTLALYPQATDTLTWAGYFDVPVRFESDEIDDIIMQRLAAGEYVLQAPSITLVEIRT